jgi:CTP:molybdopterin cytidylyltransferase MocA
MIDSIRVGLRFIEARAGSSTESASPIDGVLVIPADMPEIDAATIRACVLAFAADIGQIVIAAQRGKCGHPMVFPFAVRHAVSNLEGGLRELPRLYAGRVTLAEVGDEGIQADIDTWTEYVQACRDSPTSSA